MLPNQNQQEVINEGHNTNIKTVTDLKPKYSLSFDNTPMELSTWITCFKAYFEASRLHTLPLDQQQAFLRQYLSPNVWTAIKQHINIETRIFNNPLDQDEESFESIIEDAFQVHYPLTLFYMGFWRYVNTWGGSKQSPPIKIYQNDSNLEKKHVLAKIDHSCP